MLPVSKYTAIKQLVSSHLLRALSIYTSEKNFSEVSESDIAVYKSREICKVLYISGVALKLAKAYPISARAIASQVVSHFYECKENFQAKIGGNDSIYIEVADGVVGACLQSLLSLDQNLASPTPTLPHSHPPPLPPSHTPTLPHLFPIQYAHARCCSLLRLAMHEGLISVDMPLQVPWLDSQGKLRFNSTESQRLIANLVAAVDDLVCVDIRSHSHWHSSARSLSQAFETFWRHSHIFGEVRAKPELTYARLGLIVATQQILRLLLEEKLGTVAWFEL